MMFISIPLTGQATSADSADTIRVAAFPMHNFYNIDADGNVSGYDVDLFNEIGKLMGKEIEFVPVENWNTGQDMLDKGELDILGSVFNLPERYDKYVFSYYPGGETYTALITKSSRDDLIFEDYDNFTNLTIGCDTYYGGRDNAETFVKDYGFKNHIQYYTGLAELRQALDNGEIDAMFMSAMSIEGDEKLLARFDPRSFYYILLLLIKKT